MKELQYIKTVPSVPPISVSSTTATVVNAIDTAGFDEMLVLFEFGEMAGDMSACKLQESTASGSGYGDTTGAALTDLTAATNAEKIAAMYVNLRGHKRYFEPVVTTTGGATLLSVTALLFSNTGVFPFDITTRNVTQFIEVGSVAQ